ncbi:MAG: BNR/Asp-box repeat containing protein [Solirubrobacterales bacterium]|nr:BNR/Asp-box repeat containing protein [Solirubrobacterales bacterium]
MVVIAREMRVVGREQWMVAGDLSVPDELEGAARVGIIGVDSRRRRSRLDALCVAVLLSVVMVVQAPTAWASAGRDPLTATEAMPPGFEPDQVSCASAGNCTAVGNQGMLTETHGSWAKGITASLPANAGNADAFELDSVSCAWAGNCAAVGRYTPAYETSGLLLTESIGSWGAGIAAPLPNSSPDGEDVIVNSVSCAWPDDCTAVGSGIFDDSVDTLNTGNVPPQPGLLLTESAGVWDSSVDAPLPSNAETNGADVELNSVSCAAPGNCAAVGSYMDNARTFGGLLLTERDGSWDAGVEALLPANAAANPQVTLKSVSCSLPGDCTAVGDYVDSSGAPQGLLLTEAFGLGWARGIEARLPAGELATYTAGGGTGLQSVSCSSPGSCTAVGTYEGGAADGYSPLGVLLTETNGSWSKGVEAPLPPDGAGQGAYVLGINSVSCASAGNCTAVGTYNGNNIHCVVCEGSDQGVVLTETDGSWARGVQAPLPTGAGENPSPTAMLDSVSCTSAGNCAAVGSYNVGGLLLSETNGPATTDRSCGPVPSHVTTTAQLTSSLSGVLTPTGKLATVKAILKAGDYVFSYRALEGGGLTINWFYTPKSAHSKTAKPVLVAAGGLKIGKAGKVSVKVMLTSAGRKQFKYSHALSLASHVAFIPTCQKTVTRTAAFTLH